MHDELCETGQKLWQDIVDLAHTKHTSSDMDKTYGIYVNHIDTCKICQKGLELTVGDIKERQRIEKLLKENKVVPDLNSLKNKFKYYILGYLLTER